MYPTPTSIEDWLQIVRGEFQEIPGMRLTKPQFKRLWGLDGPTCDAIVEALEADHFLTQTSTGGYGRVDVGH